MDTMIGSFELMALIKMLLAVVCGAAIGLEREFRGRPAGLKTFAMVCLGSTLVMITNDYIYHYIAGGSGDAARMAAQVVSGIGFLGAGAIMVTKRNQIKGLTTAATLWVTAAIGICIGTGFYLGGIVATIFIYVISLTCHRIDARILSNSQHMKIYVEGENEEFLLELLEYLKKNQIRVSSLQRRDDDKWCANDVCLVISLKFKQRSSHLEFLEVVENMDGVRYVEEIG